MIQKVIYRGSRKLGSWQGCRLITFFGGWRWSGTAAGVHCGPPFQACPRELPHRSGTAGRGREVQVGSGMGPLFQGPPPPAGDTFPVACSFPMVPSFFLSCPRSHEWGLHADLPILGCKRREKCAWSGPTAQWSPLHLCHLLSFGPGCQGHHDTPPAPCRPGYPHPWSLRPMMLLGVTLEQTTDSLHGWFLRL